MPLVMPIDGESALAPWPPEPARDDLAIGRRQSTRHPLQLSGRFVTGAENVRVWIEDISETGAAVRLMHAHPIAPGRLSWLGFEQFADIAWQRDARCGLHFAAPLPSEWLTQTLDCGDRIANGDRRMQRLASAWVHGPGDY